jgi:MOSC domain-containing protein YiiM
LYKDEVAGPVWLSQENLEGDGQADRRYHGGPDKAICCFPEEHYPTVGSLAERELRPGDFGENFSFRGLFEENVCIGDRMKIGDVVVEVSQPRQPCVNLARRFDAPKLPAQMIEAGTTGFYVRVLQEGLLAGGTDVELLERPNPEWSVQRLNELMYVDKKNAEKLRAVVQLPELSEAWRSDFVVRLKRIG